MYMFLIHLRFLQIFTDIFNNDLGGPYAFLEPLFVQRPLLYKIQTRRKKRIQITVSLSASTNTQAQNIFPLYVLLARPTSNISLEGILRYIERDDAWWTCTY
eukprot:XP_020403852.1 polycomb group protein EMBRYONIC FLOWER 2-like [Zea mays]